MAEAIEETTTDPKSGNVLRTASEQRKQACDLEHVKRPDAQPPPRVMHVRSMAVPVRTERKATPPKRKEPQDPWLIFINPAWAKNCALSAWLR